MPLQRMDPMWSGTGKKHCHSTETQRLKATAIFLGLPHDRSTFKVGFFVDHTNKMQPISTLRRRHNLCLPKNGGRGSKLNLHNQREAMLEASAAKSNSSQLCCHIGRDFLFSCVCSHLVFAFNTNTTEN